MCLCATAAWAKVESIPTDFNNFSDMIHDMMESPVDYEGLFDISELVDGAYSESYYYEMNQLFDAQPEAFVAALSQQPNERIENFAFVLAFEHSQALESYRACLDRLQESVSEGSPEDDTLAILRTGIQEVETPNETLPQTSDSPTIFCIIAITAILTLGVMLKKRRFL